MRSLNSALLVNPSMEAMPDTPDDWRWCCTAATGVLALLLAPSIARAQDIEPRAYSNAPIGVNFVIAGWCNAGRIGVRCRCRSPMRTSIPRAPSSPTHECIDLGGSSGKFDVIVPYMRLSATPITRANPWRATINGFGPPAFRVSINLHGAPALALREFNDWKQDLIIGASLQVSPPWSQYDGNRL